MFGTDFYYFFPSCVSGLCAAPKVTKCDVVRNDIKRVLALDNGYVPPLRLLLLRFCDQLARVEEKED